MPRMSRTDFRLPEDLKVRVQREADAQGLDFSEFVRQSLVVRVAWLDALRAVRAGVPVDVLSDQERLAVLLARVSAVEGL